MKPTKNPNIEIYTKNSKERAFSLSSIRLPDGLKKKCVWCLEDLKGLQRRWLECKTCMSPCDYDYYFGTKPYEETEKPKRPFGDILLDLEALIDEAIDDHDIQDVDLYALLKFHIDSHRPDCRMEYLDGTFPELYFGPVRK